MRRKTLFTCKNICLIVYTFICTRVLTYGYLELIRPQYLHFVLHMYMVIGYLVNVGTKFLYVQYCLLKDEK